MKINYSEKQYEQLAEERLVSILQGIPFVSDYKRKLNEPQHRFGDLRYTVYFKDYYKPVTLVVEVKSRGERRFAEQFVQMVQRVQFENNEHCIFAAPYFSVKTTELLRSKGFDYMDLSGNCRIAIAPFFISIEGKPNKFLSYQYDKNYFSRKAAVSSSVLRTILNTYQINWKMQELSQASGASIGAVSNIKNYLIDHGWANTYRTGFRVCQIEDLLRTWATEYNKEKNRTYDYYSLDSISELERQIQKWNNTHFQCAVLGGFSAAARYAPVVRYNKLSVYIKSQEIERFVQDLELKQVSSGENVSLIIPHDDTPLLYTRIINGNRVTSPVQTILDLLSGIGRGEEAVLAIIEKEFANNE